jgi:hypothetical protein
MWSERGYFLGTLIPSSCFDVLREALAADSDKTEETTF